MVKNNKTAIKGLLVLGGVSTAAASVYTLSKKYAKKLLYRHHKQEDRPSILETKFNSQNIYIKNDQEIQLRGILIPKRKPSNDSFNFTSIWFTGKRYAIICSIF